MDKFLDTDTRGAITAFATIKVSHCEYADDILMVANEAEHLRCQLNKLYAYARAKGLTVNTEKTKILIFFSAGSASIPTFTYNDAPLEVVTKFKYLGILLDRNGKMDHARDQMARTYGSNCKGACIWCQVGHYKQEARYVMAFPEFCIVSRFIWMPSVVNKQAFVAHIY